MAEPGPVVWRGVRGSAVAAGAGVGVGVAWWLDHHARSLAVRTWSPPTGESTCAGPLQVRVLGAGSTVVLMLHGMIASGNSFGAGFDPLASRNSLLVPDLLGFGGSLAGSGSGTVDVDAHVTALDDALAQLRPSARRFVVVGHSMGGVLALHWAARRAEQITAVVTFGAPLYRTAAEADNHVAAMGRMEAFLAGDGAVPRAVCAWMCTHRRAASWVALAARPDLPVAVARAAVKHSWNTYAGSFHGLIRSGAWQPPLAKLAQARVPVVLATGAADPVPVAGRNHELAALHPTVTELVHPSAGHGLPLTHPGWCRDLVATLR